MTSSTTKYAVEAIGTFFLVLAAALGGPGAAGFMLAAMIFAGGHLSGAHYNPAVSIAVFVRGRLASSELVPYIGAQLVGGIAAGLLAGWINDFETGAEAIDDTELAIQAFLIELVVTFALAWVVLNVATSSALVNNQFYGLAIGAVVIGGGAVAVAANTAAAFNPAVGLGASIAAASDWGNIWIYLIACPLGGALAGLAFKALNVDTDAQPNIEDPA
jgi:aquaporin Z